MSLLSSSEVGYQEKLHFIMKNTFDLDKNIQPDRANLEKIMPIFSEIILFSINPKQDLTLASKTLKFSLKQLIHCFSPELFYQLLLAGGKIMRVGEDLNKVQPIIMWTVLIL